MRLCNTSSIQPRQSRCQSGRERFPVPSINHSHTANMKRSELIQRLCDQHAELPRTTVDEAVLTMLDHMTETLLSGDRIEVRGFGSFSMRSYGPRQVRNPKTGEQLSKGEHRSVHFKPGKELRDEVNTGNAS